ncbi:hypothetical protein F5Y09DRAFT_334912 [Xylaria sp. FL1042]|nr:hypothetical protein F5Y09DRAFT_334912 [Xylaria sp. FL1042]
MQHIWRHSPGQDERVGTESNETDTAIVLRTWDEYEYTEDRLAWLRALISEASYQRKYSYRVFFLVNIEYPKVHLEKGTDDCERLLRKCVPEEFRDIAFLFNERTLKTWYPLGGEYGAQEQMYQTLQTFLNKFSECEFLWQLEMALRFTGHIHDMLEASATFARNQNDAISENAMDTFASAVDNQKGETKISGPVPTSDFLSYGLPSGCKHHGVTKPPDPQVPIRNPDWCIGGEANIISFMPFINPLGTKWVYENAVHGFADGTKTPRRLAIISITRCSRRLLHIAVTVPHPIIFNRNITITELDVGINKGPLSNKAGGDRPSMLYTVDGWVDRRAQAFWDMYLGCVSLPPVVLQLTLRFY